MKLPTNRIATHPGAFLLEQTEEMGLTVNGLARESGDTWSEQDQSDLTSAALQYAAKLYPEKKNLV